MARISSSSRNDVSMSICVNSGWRSARRSSSRALDDLVVAVEACDHQHLLEELRRLRQRVEHPRWIRDGTKFARPSGVTCRARASRRREALGIEVIARGHRCAVAQHVPLHRRAPQVDHLVLEPHRFRRILVVGGTAAFARR
jgi:hypothetical protein